MSNTAMAEKVYLGKKVQKKLNISLLPEGWKYFCPHFQILVLPQHFQFHHLLGFHMFCLSMISQLPHGKKILKILPEGWKFQSRGLQDKALEGISSVTASTSIYNRSLVSTLIENSDCKSVCNI